MEYLDLIPDLVVGIITQMTLGRFLVLCFICYVIDYFLKKYSVLYRSKTHALRVFIAFFEVSTYLLHFTIYYLSYPRADMVINELFAGSLKEIAVGNTTMQVIATNILLLIITIGCRYTAVLALAKFSQQEKDNQEVFAEEKWYDKRGLIVRGVVIICGIFFFWGSFYFSVPGAAQRRVENVRQKNILNPSDSTEYRTLVKQMSSIEKQEEVIRKRQEQAIKSLQEAQKEVDNAQSEIAKRTAQYLLRLKQEQSPNEEKAIAGSFALVDKQKQQFQARYDKEMNRLRDLYDQRAGERTVLEQEEAKEGKRTARFFEVILMVLIVFITILKGKVNHIVLADYQSVMVEEIRAKVVRTTDRRESVSSTKTTKTKALGTGLKYDDRLSKLNPKYTKILGKIESLDFMNKIPSRYWDNPVMVCELIQYEYNEILNDPQTKSLNQIIADGGFPSTSVKAMRDKYIKGCIIPTNQRIGNVEERENVKEEREEENSVSNSDKKDITLKNKFKNVQEATTRQGRAFMDKLNSLRTRKSTKVESDESEPNESV